MRPDFYLGEMSSKGETRCSAYPIFFNRKTYKLQGINMSNMNHVIEFPRDPGDELSSVDIDYATASFWGGGDSGFVDNIIAYANGQEIELCPDATSVLEAVIEECLNEIFGDPWGDDETSGDVSGEVRVNFIDSASAVVELETVEMRPINSSYKVNCTFIEEE